MSFTQNLKHKLGYISGPHYDCGQVKFLVNGTHGWVQTQRDIKDEKEARTSAEKISFDIIQKQKELMTVRPFSYFFLKALPHELRQFPAIERDHEDGTKHRIGDYLAMRPGCDYDHKYELHACALSVIPTERITERICHSMLAIDNDTIFFELIWFAGNRATLYAKYNQIIGSHILGTIKTESIPHMDEMQAEYDK